MPGRTKYESLADNENGSEAASPDKRPINVFTIFCFLSGLFLSGEFTGKGGNVTKIRNMTVSIFGWLIFIAHVVFHLTHLSLGSMIEICRIANNSSNNFICNSFPEDLNKTNCSLPREYWKFSVATTIAAVGSWVSYLLITLWILIPMNSCLQKVCKKQCKPPGKDTCHQVCCFAHRKAFMQTIINPFTGSSEWSIEELCFYFHYIAVLILFLCVLICAVVYIAFITEIHDPSCVKNAVDITRIVLQLVGLFCAIQSCFIFSKIVHCITEKLKDLKDDMNGEAGDDEQSEIGKKQSTREEPRSREEETQPSAEETQAQVEEQSKTAGIQDGGNSLAAILSMVTRLQKSTNAMLADQEKTNTALAVLHSALTTLEQKEQVSMNSYCKLKQKDQVFIKAVKPTLDLYGVWFIVHWIFYSLTSVLLSAVIVEMILDVVSYRIDSAEELVPSTKAEIEAPYILYIVLFTLLHTYLFLYPCFRAAAIANERQRLINSIVKNGTCKEFPISLPSVKTNFIEYLKMQDFGFKVSIFCAEIPCGLGLAFISLFIAVCGGFLE